MKYFIIIALLPFAAQAEDGLLVSDTAQESMTRHVVERYQEMQAAPMQTAPLGGYHDEKFGDSAPAGTPMPGYVAPQIAPAPLTSGSFTGQ